MNNETAKTGNARLQPPTPELRMASSSEFLFKELNAAIVESKTVIGIISSSNKGSSRAVSRRNFKKLNQLEKILLKFPKKFPTSVIKTKEQKNNRK